MKKIFFTLILQLMSQIALGASSVDELSRPNYHNRTSLLNHFKDNDSLAIYYQKTLNLRRLFQDKHGESYIEEDSEEYDETIYKRATSFDIDRAVQEVVNKFYEENHSLEGSPIDANFIVRLGHFISQNCNLQSNTANINVARFF